MNIEKVRNVIGNQTAKEMEDLSPGDLKQIIFQANQAMKEVQDELDQNKKYQAILEARKDMESSKREVNKRQKARIAYALHLIQG